MTFETAVFLQQTSSVRPLRLYHLTVSLFEQAILTRGAVTATSLPPRPSHLSSLSIISLWPSWCTPATSPLLSATGPNR